MHALVREARDTGLEMKEVERTPMEDSGAVSEPVQDLLKAFDQLTECDKCDFVSQVLRRTKVMEWPPLDEETISRIADETFQMYDIDEMNCEQKAGVPSESGSAYEEFNHHE